MTYGTISISPTFKRLLLYIVKYRKIRGRATARLVAEQLILAYAKQLVSGMPEQLWRDNMLALINICEVEHQEGYKREVQKHKQLEKKASQSGLRTTIRRPSKRRTLRGFKAKLLRTKTTAS